MKFFQCNIYYVPSQPSERFCVDVVGCMQAPYQRVLLSFSVNDLEEVHTTRDYLHTIRICIY